ncbi:MAG: FtsX-like permease family protein [Bacteroidia bacterium]|nr:FtsX-like permease family protein [Bacteroidia bacterium]
MNLTLLIARRYLLMKKSVAAINVITWVSIGGIGVGTAALILVLSVFNGLTRFIENLFAAIDPDIKIVASAGQHFEHSDSLLLVIRSHPDVSAVTRTLEGRVWAQYVDKQAIATLKGVESDFTSVNPLDTFVYEGNFTFGYKNGIPQALFGSIVAARLSADIADETRPISLSYVPQDASLNNPEEAVNTGYVLPSGYFSVQKEYDEKFIIADFNVVRDLFEAGGRISAYEVRLNNLRDADGVQEALQAQLGPDFEVLTWYEQHRTLYRVMKNEKYISYLILALMLAIAAVNIVGSLSIIVLEKTRDIAVLKSLGATSGQIRRIFLQSGLLVGGIGGAIGVVIALTAALMQQAFGLVQLQGGESFRVKAFPIELEWADFVLVFATVMLMAAIASVYPAREASRIGVVRGLRQ